MIAAVFMLCWQVGATDTCKRYEVTPFENRTVCQIYLNMKSLEVKGDGARMALGSCIERKDK